MSPTSESEACKYYASLTPVFLVSKVCHQAVEMLSIYLAYLGPHLACQLSYEAELGIRDWAILGWSATQTLL